jgi:hypothetical protein
MGRGLWAMDAVITGSMRRKSLADFCMAAPLGFYTLTRELKSGKTNQTDWNEVSSAILTIRN